MSSHDDHTTESEYEDAGAVSFSIVFTIVSFLIILAVLIFG